MYRKQHQSKTNSIHEPAKPRPDIQYRTKICTYMSERTRQSLVFPSRSHSPSPMLYSFSLFTLQLPPVLRYQPSRPFVWWFPWRNCNATPPFVLSVVCSVGWFHSNVCLLQPSEGMWSKANIKWQTNAWVCQISIKVSSLFSLPAIFPPFLFRVST